MRVGVIGLGWAGQQHIKAYGALDGVEVAAIAGLEARARAKLAREHVIERQFERYEDLLDVEGLDAISVAVPTFMHAPIAIAALERGLHVLCEKPIARNVEEAEAMVAAARDSGRVLDVVFNHRRRGDIQTLKGLVDDGRLGRTYYAKAWWLRRSGIPTPGSWFTQMQLSGGGPLVDIGVHVLDYALFLLGNPAVTAVSASTYDLLGSKGFGGSPKSSKTGVGSERTFDVEDLATVFMRLQDGGTLLLEASWALHRADGDEFGVKLYGTEGGAELTVADYAPRGDLTLFGDDGGKALAEPVTVDVGDAHPAVVADFVRTVRSGDWSGHDGAAAAELARIVDACYRSAAEQREVRLDAVGAPSP
jgi:predicted dehydrogenase